MAFNRYVFQNGSMNGAHHRYIQPPQVAYLVTTVDEHGNMNTTPVTMGTCIGHNYFSFTLSNLMVENWDQTKYPYADGVKQGYCNLMTTPECVISYFGADLLRQSWIAGMPVPKGISEIDVAGLTALPSKLVKPCGIAECPINLEARVLYTHSLGEKWTHYICEVVCASIDERLDAQNKTGRLAGYGMLSIDPLLEVFIGAGGTPETDSTRLVYAKIDMNSLTRCPEDVGCKDEWIGTFAQWMDAETARGKLTEDEKARALSLEQAWAQNRDPAANAAVREELTALLQKAVRKV